MWIVDAHMGIMVDAESERREKVEMKREKAYDWCTTTWYVHFIFHRPYHMHALL